MSWHAHVYAMYIDTNEVNSAVSPVSFSIKSTEDPRQYHVKVREHSSRDKNIGQVVAALPC